jgi:hypothetical protein
VLQPRRSKYISPGREPWGAAPRPAFGTPLPRRRETGRSRKPMACAMGYCLLPASRA